MLKIKRVQTLLFAAGVVCLVHGSADSYRINQLGYYPEGNKVVPVVGAQDSTFFLVKATGDTVYRGELSAPMVWTLAQDTVRQADFSDFKDEGIFWILTADKGKSPPVRISSNVLYDISLASLKTFYFQRASMPLEEQYAGRFAREAGHPDTACLFHPSTGRTDSLPTASSPGGWYDAGDYGKYTVNAGITVAQMLSFYENFGDYFGDAELNIPESNNGIDDLLDEIKYELDWLLTMQDTDGGVFHKLTTLQHAPMEAAPHEDRNSRYFIGKGTAATLDFAAVMAMAGRIYGEISSYSDFADTCVNRAIRAWEWAVQNPDSIYNQDTLNKYYTPKVGTGSYGDGQVADEFKWAASELFITTGDASYADSINFNTWFYNWPASWADVGRLAPLSLATVPNDLSAEKLDQIQQQIITQANSYLSAMAAHPYRIPNQNFFYWGSNAVFANAGIFLCYAYLLTNDTTYIRGAAEISDYLLGKNAVNTSFVTGYGVFRSEFPHHRPSYNDTIDDPIPGFLVGGPNGSPKNYSDVTSNYTTNEVAINWNAPSSVLFAIINKILGRNESTPNDGPFYLITSVEGTGLLEISPEQETYEPGTVVTLKAKPVTGQMFLGWSGAASGLDSQVTVTIHRDTRVTAKFGKPGEMVLNGSFSSGNTNWSISINEGAAAQGQVIGGEYRIAITNGGTADWHIQFQQGGIQLLQGAEYEFSFDARADSNRTMVFDVCKSVADYSTYMVNIPRLARLTTEMQTFKVRFTMTKPTDLGARITFNCGMDTDTIWIDNVSLKMFDPSPVIFGAEGRKAFVNPLRFQNQGNRIMMQLTIADPAKAWLKVFDAQGRLRKNYTSKINVLNAGVHSLPVENRFTPGLYVIRFFDGVKFHTGAWTNVPRSK